MSLHWNRFRQDAARWVQPEAIAPLEVITPRVACNLLFQYQSLRAMAWFRVANLADDLGIRGVHGYVKRRLLRLYGLELSPRVPVGGGLYIAHPVGNVLHAESIGENVTVIGQVTFGTRDDSRWPRIGDRVFLGVGARVLGGITVGDDARVGANAVVIDDVPVGYTAVGIPAATRPPRRPG